MTVEVIQAIGEHIVTPICYAAVAIAIGYFLLKKL